jgi:ATP-binding cassette subfamily B protein
MTSFNKAGVSLMGISDTAERIGFRTRGVKIKAEQLGKAPLPAIIHWDRNHFVVLTEMKKKVAKIADPSKGIISYKTSEFLKHWKTGENDRGDAIGIALLLEPTSVFYSSDGQKEQKLTWSFVTTYLQTARWQITQVFAALITTSLLSLLIPFLTQSVVDIGINTQNLQYVSNIVGFLDQNNALTAFLFRHSPHWRHVTKN